MARKDREELQAFAQKMHDEGAAGFASGLSPWETWDDFEDRVGSRRVWQGASERVADRERPSRSFGDRVLTTMTVLAVTTLVIGIAGVYITQESAVQVADNRSQLPSTRLTMTPEAQLPRQGTAMDSRKESIAFKNAWTPATETPTSPFAAASIKAVETATEPSGAQSVSQGSDTPLPATPADDISLLATLDEESTDTAIPVAPPTKQKTSMGSNNDTTAPEPDTDRQLTLAALNNLPAPVAGIPATAVDNTGHDRPAPGTSLKPAPEPVEDTKPETIAAEPGNSAPVQPVHLSQVTVLDVHTEPLQAPVQDIRPGTPAGNTGDWSINIASYLKQPTAEKMRSRFLDKGVATDMVTAIVNGKTYYRLRVTGFESKSAARTQSTTIKEKLGLKETWITKQ